MSGSFEVLDAGNAEARARWLSIWSAWPGREISAHPDYVRLFAREGDQVLAAVYSTGGGAVLFPLIARPLAAEAWAGAGETACDLTSPYGYGGSFAWGVDEEATAAFWAGFDRWTVERGAVTTFARLSLFPEQLAPVPGAEVNARNVVRTLDASPEEIWRDYAHKVRKNVNRARAAGVVIEADLDGRRLDEFVAIYHSTMDRRGAAQGYYFPRSFFADIVATLPGQYAFFHALAGGRVVSTELVLVSTHHMYSFLGGTREDAFDLRPNDLLKHEAIEWGCRAGKRAFVLGGGYGGEDGIFKYKLAFAPGGERTFRVAKRTHDAARSDALVGRRRAWEQAQGREWSPREGYFPPYRG